MDNPIERLLSFELSGPVAQFRKFYSNVSALSYEIPPRTVLAGILASVLELPRDSYYEVFGPDKSKFTVQLHSGIRKYMAYTNYQNPKERKTIQTRVQLLFPDPDEQHITYKVFFAHGDNDLFDQVSNRLQEGNTGFGIYLGQRQFRATIRNVRKYTSKELTWKNNYEGTLQTATFSENLISLDQISGYDVMSSSMPLHMQKVEGGREPVLTGEIVYEISGKGLKGVFKEALKLPEKHIAFLSKLDNG